MKFLDKLEGLNVEVGSHCYHHPFLYLLPPAVRRGRVRGACASCWRRNSSIR